MTDVELNNYLWKLCSNTDISKDKNVVGWNAKNFYHQLSDSVYEKYGTRLSNPINICESLNPFTVHFTWDNNNGNVLGCSINDKPEVYICFNRTYFIKDESDTFKLKNDNWKEFVYLPNLKVSDRLMETFYSYYLVKKQWLLIIS